MQPKTKIIIHSITAGLYEVSFILVPILVYLLILFSLGKDWDSIRKLSEWPFASVMLFTQTLRDTLEAMKDGGDEGIDKNNVVLFSVIGIIASTALLAVSIASQGTPSPCLIVGRDFETLQFTVLPVAGCSAWLMRSFLIYRRSMPRE